MGSGDTTITDGRGVPRNVYISVTRDGGIWVRVGLDYMSYDWHMVREHKRKMVVNFLSGETLQMLQFLNYTDQCVLSDLDLEIKMDSGWHQSVLKVFRTTGNKLTEYLIFRHNQRCSMNTTLALSPNKQGLVCDGGTMNACGLKGLPTKGTLPTTVTFLVIAKMDPDGPNRRMCQGPATRLSYTMLGSFYHMYVKIADCPPPKGKTIQSGRVIH